MIQELKEELLSLYQEGSFRFECDDDDFEKSVIAKLPIKSPTKYTCIASMYLWRDDSQDSKPRKLRFLLWREISLHRKGVAVFFPSGP